VVHVTTIVVSLAPKLRWTPLGSCDVPALAVDVSARVSKIVSQVNALHILAAPPPQSGIDQPHLRGEKVFFDSFSPHDDLPTCFLRMSVKFSFSISALYFQGIVVSNAS
jgi:hypothetical protein